MVDEGLKPLRLDLDQPQDHVAVALAGAAPTSTATADPGVVLCVADGIVRIVSPEKFAPGDDPGSRPRRGINLLIGVAAGEDKRCDHDRDAEGAADRRREVARREADETRPAWHTASDATGRRG
jgi:hypothetical protein